MRLQELTEGVNDPHIFKAVFMLGGPGSGKSYIAKRLTGGTGLKTVNLDDAFEHLTIGPDAIVGKGFEHELYRHAGRITQTRMDTYIDGRLGLLLDGTGRKIQRLSKTKQHLESLGYDTMAVFVNTEVNVALDRNETRKRKVDPEFLKGVHADLKLKMGDLQRLFKGNLLIVDNTDPEAVDFEYNAKVLNQFLNSPPTKQAAKKWTANELQPRNQPGYSSAY